jgi:molybdate transport system ATP-binding protein
VSGALDAHLVVRRGDFVLDVALHLEPGEVVAVLGPNGSGKSTLLGAVAGLIRPESGTVVVGNRVLTRAGGGGGGTGDAFVAPERRGVGLLGQEPLLFPHLDARDNVAFGLLAHGARRAAAHRDATKWLAAVGLSGLERRKSTELSGGQQQRVALARALAAQPEVLLLDEPLAALDVQTAALMRQLLRERLRNPGAGSDETGTRAPLATVLVTHDVLDAVVLADRVVILHDGRAVDEGPAARVLGQPRNRFAAALAGVNLVTGVFDGGGTTDARVRLPDGRIFAGASRGSAATPGDPAAVTFRPSAVSVASTPPHASELESGSVNHWQATIAGLEPSAGGVLCRLAGDQEIVAELPPMLVAELALEAGTPVWFAVDQSAVTVLPLR